MFHSQNIAAERIVEGQIHSSMCICIYAVETLYNITEGDREREATGTSDRKFIKLNSLFIAIKARINIDCLHLCDFRDLLDL